MLVGLLRPAVCFSVPDVICICRLHPFFFIVFGAVDIVVDLGDVSDRRIVVQMAGSSNGAPISVERQ